MKRFRFRFLMLGIALILVFSAVRTSSINAAADTEAVMAESLEEEAEDTVNGTSVGMMVSGIVMIVIVMSFLGRVEEKKKKKYIKSNLSLS